MAFIQKADELGKNLLIIGIYNGKFLVSLSENETGNFHSSEIPATTWQLVTVSFQRLPTETLIKLYLNESLLINVSSQIKVTSFSGKPWAIGQNWDGNNETSDFWYGRIDDLKIENYLLSTDEIQKRYQSYVNSSNTKRLFVDGSNTGNLIATLDLRKWYRRRNFKRPERKQS